MLNIIESTNEPVYYDSEADAKKVKYNLEAQKLLVVELEKTLVSVFFERDKIKIVALNQFGFSSREKEQINYQPFQSKFHKLSFFRDYVNDPTHDKLNALLDVMAANELHSLADLLVKEKMDSARLIPALDNIEKVLVER